MANPKLGEGVTATAEAGPRHVRLKVEYTQAGWVARVLETDGNTEVAREIVGDLESGKKRLEEIAYIAILPTKTSRCPRLNGKRDSKQRIPNHSGDATHACTDIFRYRLLPPFRVNF